MQRTDQRKGQAIMSKPQCRAKGRHQVSSKEALVFVV